MRKEFVSHEVDDIAKGNTGNHAASKDKECYRGRDRVSNHRKSGIKRQAKSHARNVNSSLHEPQFCTWYSPLYLNIDEHLREIVAGAKKRSEAAVCRGIDERWT